MRVRLALNISNIPRLDGPLVLPVPVLRPAVPDSMSPMERPPSLHRGRRLYRSHLRCLLQSCRRTTVLNCRAPRCYLSSATRSWKSPCLQPVVRSKIFSRGVGAGGLHFSSPPHRAASSGQLRFLLASSRLLDRRAPFPLRRPAPPSRRRVRSLAGRAGPSLSVMQPGARASDGEIPQAVVKPRAARWRVQLDSGP